MYYLAVYHAQVIEISGVTAAGVEGIGEEDSSLGIYTDVSGQRGMLFLKVRVDSMILSCCHHAWW